MLWNGERFLDMILHNLEKADISNLHVIMNGEEVVAFRNEFPHLFCFVNHEPEKGMISSIRIGVEQSPPSDGYMIIMVDHPFVQAETYRTLQEAFLENPGALIKPVYQGKPGHPVIVPHVVFEKGFSNDPNITLHDMIVASGVQVQSVEVDDDGVASNVNTLDQLRSKR